MTNGTILGKILITSALEEPKEMWGLRFEGNRVIEIGPNDTLRKKYGDNDLVDATDKIIMPGFINSHMHMYSVLSQGRYFGKVWADVYDKLVEFIWKQIENRITHELIRVTSALSSTLMVRSGITTVCDILEAPYAVPGCLDVAAEVISNSGMRATLMFEGTERISPENGQLGLAENESFIRNHQDSNDRISGMVCVHTTFTCSLPYLKQARAQADRLGTYLHMFVSESNHEVLHCMRTYGLRPIEVYEQIGYLGPDVLASMAVHVNEREIALMAKRKVNVAYVPLSAANPGVGVAPIPEFLAQDMTVGMTAYPSYDYFDAMRGSIWIQRAHRRDGSILPTKTILDMATASGGRAIGKKRIGVLEKDNFADLIIVDGNFIAPLTSRNVYDLLIFHCNPNNIDTVIINGEYVMRNKRMLLVDEEEVFEEARQVFRQFWI